MLKYEAPFRDGWKPCIRVFDTETQKSKTIHIDDKYEYYVPYSKGSYTFIGDKTLKMDKCLGTYKDSKDQFGVFNPTDRYVRDNFWRKSYNDNPRIWYLDIETRSEGAFPAPEHASQQICLIQFFDTVSETMFVLGLRDFEFEPGYSVPYNFKYLKFLTEYEMLEAFVKIFKKADPLIIYAWNGYGFDFPYLYNRFKKIGLNPDDLSNYGKCKLEENEFQGKLEFKFSSSGHYFIDLMDIFKKFSFTTYPSYSLDYVGRAEVKESKVKHDEFITFDSFYTGKDYNISDKPYDDPVREEIRQLKIAESTGQDFDAKRFETLIQFQFVWYGIQDVMLLKKIDNKRNLTPVLINIAQEMGCSVSEAVGTVRPWNCFLQNLYFTKKIVCPKRMEGSEGHDVIGGFVKPPVTGIHKWVMNYDVNSMYPLLSIKAHNISPETFIPTSKLPADLREHLLTYFNDQNEDKLLDYPEDVWKRTEELTQKYDVSIGINGAVYSRKEEGVVPGVIAEIYYGRKKDKKKMLSYEQQAEIIKEILRTRN